MKNRVVIVGSNQLTRHLINWEQDADYWLFNEAAARSWAKTVTGVFQLHNPYIWRNRNNVNDPGHYSWLQEKHDFPIYMLDQYPDVPSSVKYPLDDVSNKLLSNIRRKNGDIAKYFTSSVAYAIALAIYNGYNEIELAAIEMASGTEYSGQLPGVLLWIGIAAGNGINVILQNETKLMKSHLYGYQGEIVIHRQRFEICANGYEPKLETAKTKVFEAAGKVNLLLAQLATEKNQERAQMLFADLQKAMNEKSDLDFQYGVILGAFSENKKYISEVDELIKAAGGERTLQTMAATI